MAVILIDGAVYELSEADFAKLKAGEFEASPAIMRWAIRLLNQLLAQATDEVEYRNGLLAASAEKANAQQEEIAKLKRKIAKAEKVEA